MRTGTLASLLAALLLAAPARAHDYWLAASPTSPARGAEVAISLWVGEDFVAASQKPMDRARTTAFRVVHAAGQDDLLPEAVDGSMPLLRYQPAATGGHLLALERGPTRITMRARKFNHYLEHEGLLAALAARRALVEHHWSARERYTRYLKVFVQVGDGVDSVSTKVLGQRIELVPDRDLAQLRPGDRLGVVLYFEGRPLPGAQVEVFVRGTAGARGQKATSDAAGRVEFSVERAGTWLVRAVHMQRCVGCRDADWESFWAAYGFAVP